ncbi:sugar-binding protein [Pseudomonas sp. ZT5P21]
MSSSQSKTVPRLPPPSVEQAVGRSLVVLPSDGTTGITVNVPTWRSRKVGQPTTLCVYGENDDGSIRMELLVDREPLTQDEYLKGWSRIISWEFLQGLLHGSHLTFVFQVPLGDNGGTCPDLFPPLSLVIHVLYQDITTFSADDGTDNWNRWMRGEAGVDLRDLIVAPDGSGYALFNKTHTNKSAGVLLRKTFHNLQVGRVYNFGIDVSRWIGRYEKPKLSLVAGNVVIVPPTEITSEIRQLEGWFTAGSSQMELTIDNDEVSGLGNDFSISRIWLASE